MRPGGVEHGQAVEAGRVRHADGVGLAVGLVLALQPLVGIWGAIAIVVGVMLLGVAALVMVAVSKGRLISEMFASDESDTVSDDDASKDAASEDIAA